ncbi:MAG: hydrogenase maturation protease [Acidobacteriota bacterium]|nr:MAG: hydrogenase maturation protease [Acidobacteriota bacterium]
MTTNRKTLVLGIGNVLMGDEGIGVHVVNEVASRPVPDHVECLDGGTGSFNLLEPMQTASRVVLIDATVDGGEAGRVSVLRPRFSKDYPRTLTAHDIGLKDLIDAFYLLGDEPEVTLFAVSIDHYQDMTVDLSEAVKAAVPKVADMVMEEAAA